MDDSYQTIQQATVGIYKEKGSKFLAFAYPVESEDEALYLIDTLKKEYHDAKHHCYAYILGAKGKYHRTNDAGEPRHSAGDPILNQIRSFEISDVLVVVVRYFGGTKLGKSGLINAYKSATKDALGKTDLAEKILHDIIKITFQYEGLNDVMRLVNGNNIQLLNQIYEKDCYIRVMVRESELYKIKCLFEVIPYVKEVEILPRGS